MIENKVLLDAASMLETAARQLKKLTKTVQCTPEYENKIISVAIANIHAALARIGD